MTSIFKVFVQVGYPIYTYVDRPELDRLIEAWAAHQTKHLLIFGPSKSGKTSLWKKHVDPVRTIKVGCNEQKSIEELYREILFALNAHYDEEVNSGSKTHMNIGASLKQLLGFGTLKIEGKVDQELSKNKVETPVTSPPITANIVSKYLKPSGKLIILEDFHYASDELKRKLSQDLKVFSDDEVSWIVVGVQHKTSEILSYNTDLQLRIAEIPVEGFADKQLRIIFEKGQKKLKIDFSNAIKDRILVEANGSASLIQGICLKMCQISGLINEQQDNVVITNESMLEQACVELAGEQRSYYTKLVQHVSKGGRSDGSTEKYKWFLKLIKETSIPESGLKNTEVFHALKNLGHSEIDQGSVTGGLSYLPKMLTKANFPSFFDYDVETKTFYLMDRQMKFVFKWLPELVDSLFEEKT